MIHERDEARRGCDFEVFFVTTPQDLLDVGLYNGGLATAFVSGENHHKVSHTLVV
jgi:hypothetical protein